MAIPGSSQGRLREEASAHVAWSIPSGGYMWRSRCEIGDRWSSISAVSDCTSIEAEEGKDVLGTAEASSYDG